MSRSSAQPSVLNRQQLDVLLPLGGSVNIIAELVGLFDAEVVPRLQQLRLAVVGRDADAVERGAHSLKSSAATLGGERAAAAALALEMLGRSRGLDGAEDLLVKLEGEVGVLRRELHAFLDGLRQPRA